MKVFKEIPCGKTSDNGQTSIDYYSLGYQQCINEINDFKWYDVLPYAPTLWIQHYKENTWKGHWWLHRESYCNMCMEYAVAGSAEYTVDGETHLISAGEILVTYPGNTITVSDHNGAHFHRIQLIISGSVAKIAPETLGLLKQKRFKLDTAKSKDKFNSLLKQISALFLMQNEENAEQNSKSAYEILMLLANLCKRQSRGSEEFPEVLTNTINRMKAGKLEDLSISTLAAMAGVSRMTLTTLFQKHLNTTPLTYWLKLKMEHAKMLLSNSSMPIKAISVELGFKNQLYFSTVFRRHFGIPPTAYRKLYRKDMQ